MSVETDLTALLAEHVCRYFGPASSDTTSHCECGWWGENYPAHVASVVSAAYTLTPKERRVPVLGWAVTAGQFRAKRRASLVDLANEEPGPEPKGFICTRGPLEGQTISREETS